MKGIVFDFNGTLFQDGDFNEIAWRKFIEDTFHTEVKDEDFVKYFHGIPNWWTLEHYAGRPLSHAERYELSENGKELLYKQLILDKPERQVLTTGTDVLLDKIKAQGIPYSIATAAARGNMDFYFEHLGIDRWFSYDTNIIYDDGSFPGKPEPDIYLKSFKLLGLKPEECIVVEDAPTGIEAARRAGAGLIIGIDPEGKNKLTENEAVDHVIRDFTDWQEAWLA